MDRLYTIKSLMDEVIPFVQQVYFNDACAIAALYPEWMTYGGGVHNYLAVPDLPLNAQASAFDLPGGIILDGNIAGAQTFLHRGRYGVPSCRDRRPDPRLVQGQRAAASLAGRDPAAVHRLRRERQILLGEGAALRRTSDAGWSARAGADRLRAGTSADEEVDRPGAGEDLGHQQAQGHGQRSAIDHGPARGARHPLCHVVGAGGEALGVPGRPTSAAAIPRPTIRQSFPTAKSKAWARTKRRAARCPTGW